MSCSDDLLLLSSEAERSETSSGDESIDGDADNVEYTANCNDDDLPPLEEGSSYETSELLSGIDDVEARYQLGRSIQEVRSLINGKPDLSKILDFETQNGLLSLDDVNKLFTEEELKMDRSMLRVTKWRKFTEKRWNSLSETTQRQATQLFHYSGLDLFPNNPKRKAIHPREISVKNKHAVCSKYQIEGDNYFYNFNAVSTNIVNLKEDYCLSIGSCSFFPAFQDKTFNYESYLKYLQKYVLVDNVVPIIFNPSRERRPMNNSVGASQEIDTSMILNGEWLNSTLGDSFDPVICEKTLFHHELVILPSDLKERSEQAALLENMGDEEYCVLTFGQFQQLSGLLMKTVAVEGKRERVSKKLGGYIMLKHLRCKWGKSFSCTRRVTIIVDALHRVVFMRCSGKHDSERCIIENRKKCFLAYRNVMMAHNQKNNAEDTFNHVKHEYEDVFHIISELGVFPTAASLNRWKKHKTKSQSPLFVDPAVFKDYFECCEMMNFELKRNRIYTRASEGIRSVRLPSSSVVHGFYYQENSLPGLIFSSQSSLQALADATWWSADATFNMLQNSDIKCITVSFKRLREGYKPQVFLGAIATLPGGESTHNFCVMFQELIKLISMHVSGPLKLETVITDESTAEMQGINEAFEANVNVVNCTWHKSLTFEKHLNCYGVKEMQTALNAITETDFYAIFASLISSFNKSYNDADKQIRNAKSSAELGKKVKWYTYKRDQSKKLAVKKTSEYTLTEVRAKYGKMIGYLHRLWISKTRWALFSRGTFKQHEATLLSSRNSVIERSLKLKYPFYGQGKKKCREVIFNIVTSHGINYRDDAGDTYQEVEVKELLRELNEKDFVFDPASLEIARSLQQTPVSTQSSETMHSALKKAHKMKHLKTVVDLSDKLNLYFMRQDARFNASPTRETASHNIADMQYLQKLTDAQAQVFITEHKKVHKKGKTLLLKNLLTLIETKVLDINCIGPCLTCSLCIALSVPCRHSMANLMYQMLIERPNLSDTSKMNIVKYQFVRKLDELLMLNYYPITWSNRLKKASSQGVGGPEKELLGPSKENSEDNCHESNSPTVLPGNNYAATEELTASIFDYLHEWTNRDPDSPERLQYIQRCASLLKSFSMDDYKAPLDLPDE